VLRSNHGSPRKIHVMQRKILHVSEVHVKDFGGFIVRWTTNNDNKLKEKQGRVNEDGQWMRLIVR